MFSQSHGSFHTFHGQSAVTHDPNYRLPTTSLPPSPSSTSRHSRNPSFQSQPHGTDQINRPTYFSSGQFREKTIRMQLDEIQKADLGRKYARVDRRPLDPPPVVQLRLFQVHDPDSAHPTETELDYAEVQVFGLLCTVDLFPVPGPDYNISANGGRSRHSMSAPATQTTFFPPSPPLQSYPGSSSPQSQGYTFVSELAPSRSPARVNEHTHRSPYTPRHLSTHFSGYALPPSDALDVVHHVEDYPITESSKQTQSLVGATFVQPHLVDYQGKKAIVFVFSDLAVKIEGSFILRYRAFDIFTKPAIAVTAENYGGVFRVYSTKEFPGLAASTELTKLLARWGVRLNIRETERRRRKKGEKRTSSSDDDEYD